jgi:Zn-dependent protease with chaperone function
MDNLFQTPQPEASANKNLESGQSPSLAAGIDAMKRKDYAMAIAHLKAVAQTDSNKATALKAQMTLVMAYQRIGDPENALAYCQPLCASSNKQVQAWAVETLATLQRSIEPADPTGFTPLNADIPVQTSTPLDVEAEADETGFVPLDQQAQTNLRQSVPVQAEQGGENISPSLYQADDFTIDRDTAEDYAVATNEDYAVATDIEPLSDTPNASEAIEPSVPPSLEEGHLISTIRRRSGGTARQTAPLPNERPVPTPLKWRMAGRAQKWSSLGAVDIAPLWALEIGTVIALVLVINTLFHSAIALANQILGRVMWPIDLRVFVIYADPFWLSVALTIALFFLSPWLLDRILRRFYGAKSSRLDDLNNFSPETVRVFKRICNQKRLPAPAIRLLPTPVPLVLTYGSLPQTAKIAVSQGLLNSLNDDEIAAVLLGEMGHIVRWDFAVMSLVVLAAQLPYLMYWTLAQWGDRQHSPILRPVAIVLSAIGYGLFWLLRWVGLWLARVRIYYSDRTAVETTGNPNGLTRALLKIAIGIDEVIHQQEYTNYLLEGFDVLAPVGYQSALTIGSVYPYSSLENLLEWDRVNPYRRWLTINNTHPPMGDRLQRLAQYARHWRLEPELALPTSAQSPRLFSTSTTDRSRFWLQTAPFIGILLGIAMALLLWLVGSFSNRLNLPGLAWMQGDASIFWGCLLTGFSLGTVLRINAFFPDITPRNVIGEPNLADLLTPTLSLPVDSQPVRLRGRLLGRSGISNQLHQDLILATDTGLIKLHHCSKVGPLGDLLPQSSHPAKWVKKTVIVTGWFRRGATPWIDIETLQSQQGQKIYGGHPIWSTLLVVLASLLAASIILGGGQF